MSPEICAFVGESRVAVTELLFHATKADMSPEHDVHNFTLLVPESNLAVSIMRLLDNIGARPLPKDTCHRIFELLKSETTFLPGYGCNAAWMLNTIDEITEERGRVQLRGRCSPI
jgi:hypothetical protein